MKLNYFVDPKNDLQSVSLTLLMVSFLLLTVLSVLNALEYVKDVGPMQELFYATAALYFGRRVNINGKAFSSEGQENSKGKK